MTRIKLEIATMIRATGKPNDQANARVEMLQKWKREKTLRKQQESKLRKPAFKVGVTKPNPPPLGNKPLFALDASSRLYKSSFQVSNSQLSIKKQESLNASNTKTSAKVSNSETCAKKPAVATANIKTYAKQDANMQSSGSKIQVSSRPESKLTRNKESGIQSLSKPKINMKSKVEPVVTSKKQSTICSKAPLETKKESRIQPPNTRPKPTSLAKDAKSCIPSCLPKASASRTLSSEPKQAIPIPKKNNCTVKSLPKFTKTVASQPKGKTSEKPSKPRSEMRAEPQSNYQSIKCEEAPTFECELSHIEPVKEQRKSFAPPGFMFQPPVELNSSLFLEDGPSAIFMRMKNQLLRTSTPIQSPSVRKSNSETEDSKCPENEDVKSEKNEDVQFSKIENKVVCSQKNDIEAALSSSLESVVLNEMKNTDCKKSLNFEFPEAALVKNQEVLLPSKMHSELSLVREPTPDEVIKTPIEIDNTKVDSTDIRPLNDDKFGLSASKADSVFYQAEMLSSSNITLRENSLAKDTDTITDEAISQPVLLDAVEIVKTDRVLDSTSCNRDSKITLPSFEAASVPGPIDVPTDENTENIQSVPNGFPQKQEGSIFKFPERKIRNLRQSEKPGLASINESNENTPQSAMKKKILDSVLTPRRSLRLAKLSGNFSSLENLLSSPKPKENKGLKNDFTPRRSLRLSRFSTEFSSTEDLFDVRRPTLYGSPTEDETVPKLHSRTVMYDFDKLSLETEEVTHPRSLRAGKISLLYTPPDKSRPSNIRKSTLKGDLISFSPNI